VRDLSRRAGIYGTCSRAIHRSLCINRSGRDGGSCKPSAVPVSSAQRNLAGKESRRIRNFAEMIATLLGLASGKYTTRSNDSRLRHHKIARKGPSAAGKFRHTWMCSCVMRKNMRNCHRIYTENDKTLRGLRFDACLAAEFLVSSFRDTCRTQKRKSLQDINARLQTRDLSKER